MWIYCHEKFNINEIQDKDGANKKKKKGEDELIERLILGK